MPEDTVHNAHMYYILLENTEKRNELIRFLKVQSINAVFHYIPLHIAPAGIQYGRTFGKLPVTEDISGRLLRLPLWVGLEETQERVISSIIKFMKGISNHDHRYPSTH